MALSACQLLRGTQPETFTQSARATRKGKRRAHYRYSLSLFSRASKRERASERDFSNERQPRAQKVISPRSLEERELYEFLMRVDGRGLGKGGAMGSKQKWE